MPQDKLKMHKNYIFYRLYGILAILVWNAACLWEFTRGFPHGPPKYIFMVLPIMLPAMFMGFNLSVFPLKFSVFGPYERTSFPNEPSIIEKRASSGRISWFHASIPFFTWIVFPSGLGIKIFGVGSGFIPVEQMTQLQQKFLQGYELKHNSAEIRSPIVLPSKDIFEAVQVIMRRYGRDVR